MKHTHRWDWLGGGLDSGVMYCKKLCATCGEYREIRESDEKGAILVVKHATMKTVKPYLENKLAKLSWVKRRHGK